MNVFDYLLEGKRPSAVALLTLQGEHTYGRLRAAALKVSRRLLAGGAKKGDRALLLAESGEFWVAAYLGILHAGLVCVPLPSRILAEDLDYISRVTQPAFLFIEARHQPRIPKGLRQLPTITDEDLAPQGDGELGTRQCDTAPDDLAALMFTSGSTGKPRGVMISHGNIIANTDSIIEYLSLTAQDRIMAVLPFHYCFGTSLLHTHLRVGGSIVVDPRFMYPEKVLQRMQETSCTGFAGVPSHFQILLRKSKFARTTFPRLRYLQQAGGPLAPNFIRELCEALPDKQFFVMYGQTEATARLSYLSPDLLPAKLGSVGKGIPGVTLAVLSEAGVAVRPGEIGEIVAEGANIALGYWNDSEETARCFRDGKLYTGDLATADEDGLIFIVDRAKDFLKCGGKRVSCRQLENVLLEHHELLEAAVVGAPDEILGEAAIAYVVPRDHKQPPSVEQLNAYCRQRLPLPFVPKRFVVLKSLPKNSSGKILKPLLKAQAIAS